MCRGKMLMGNLLSPEFFCEFKTALKIVYFLKVL